MDGTTSYLHSFKLILLLVIWSWKCNIILKKEITSLWTLVIRVCQTMLNIFPYWISKPRIQKHKDYSKTSSGAGKFVQNLCACRNSLYNVRNCKSGKHNQRYTFRCHKSRQKPTSINIPYYDLKIKERKKNGNTKTPPPHWGNWMLHAIKHCQNISLWNSTEWHHLFYLSINRTCVMITYSWIQKKWSMFS